MTPLSKSLFTDNGPHYHKSAVLMYLAEVNSVFPADTECGIQRSGQQIDIFGRNAVQQLANVLIQEAQNNTPKSCSVIIAYSNPGNIHLLAQWLDAMMAACWQQSLTIASLTKVFYF